MQHCPHVRRGRCLLTLSWPSISTEPLHASSVFDTCNAAPCPFMSKALCGFQPGSLVKLKSPSLQPLTRPPSLPVDGEEPSARRFHVSQQNKRNRGAKNQSAIAACCRTGLRTVFLPLPTCGGREWMDVFFWMIKTSRKRR